MITTVKDLVRELLKQSPDRKIYISDDYGPNNPIQLVEFLDRLELVPYFEPSKPVKLSPEEEQRQKEMGKRWDTTYISEGTKKELSNKNHQNSLIPDPHKIY